MKKSILSFLVLFSLILVFSCGENSSSVKNSKDNLTFEQIGYFKNSNKLRYFTFYVKSDSLINPNSINQNVFDEIEKHGSKQTNTSGEITASFYYLNKEQTPDITLLSAQEANDLAHNKKPIAAVWIMPNGQINFIKNPE